MASVHQKQPPARVATSNDFEIPACPGPLRLALNLPTDHDSSGLSERSPTVKLTDGASLDAQPPKTGHGFLPLSSTLYRLEMLAITLATLVVLFYWRLFVVGDLNLPLTIFWILWPDLGSFIPIGLAMHGSKDWPSWGPRLYNTLHTFLAWIPVFTIWSLATNSVQWPLLGWAGHITADRTVGYYLRASKNQEPAHSPP